MKTNLAAELSYRYHECIGNLVGTGNPTPEQEQYCRKVSEEKVREIERDEAKGDNA